MDEKKVLDAFFYQGIETRLDVFRLHVKAGAKGMAAVEIACAY